jgi:hypothetical protein
VGAHPATEQLDDRVVELLVDGGIRSVDERVDLTERRRFTDRLVRRRVAPVDEQTAARVRDDRADPAEKVGPERVIGEIVATQDERYPRAPRRAMPRSAGSASALESILTMS